MSMLDRLSDWLAERQERQLVRKAGGTELTGNGVSLSAFMEAFDMPEDTRARMEAMAGIGLTAKSPEQLLKSSARTRPTGASLCGPIPFKSKTHKPKPWITEVS